MENGSEQRQYERVFFSASQHIEGSFSVAQDASDEYQVAILNLSEGGMHFTQSRDGMKNISEGDIVILRGMSGPDPLNFTQDIKMAIKWILDTDFLEHVSYGCEFLDLTPDLREKIRDVVTNGLPGPSY